MESTFNFAEILEMACEIERQGARFYRQAADYTADPDARRVLRELAVEEHAHEHFFKELQELAEQSEAEGMVPDVDAETAAFLRAMVAGIVFPQRAETWATVADTETAADILRMALQFERDSVAFYAGLKAAMPPPWNPDRVDMVLREEMRHVTRLSRELQRLAIAGLGKPA